MAYTKGLYSFPYGIAAYPKKFKEYVISPHKICLQFTDVQCKLRPLGHETLSLARGNRNAPVMPVSTKGTDIDTLAVGIPLHLYPELLTNIIKALKEHGNNKILEEVLNGQQSPDL